MSDGVLPVVAEGVGKRFGDVVALDDVSLEVRPGEVVGLVGPDGGGKTTLFRILATLMLPDSGSATVLGEDVVGGLWNVRSRIGYMPGRFSLYPDLSVEENVRFFASVFGTTLEAGYATIEPIYSQIEPFRDRPAGALSGGMKQKLALSCSLVHRPELLFLDEPTTGVDAVSRRELWELLGGLRDSGMPMLVSTPYMDEASRCDQVVLMQQGRMLASGTPDVIGDLFPGSLFGVRGRERFRLLTALRAYQHAGTVTLFGEELHYADARPDAPDAVVVAGLREYLDATGFQDATIEVIEPGIEDVFMALMGSPVTADSA